MKETRMIQSMKYNITSILVLITVLFVVALLIVGEEKKAYFVLLFLTLVNLVYQISKLLRESRKMKTIKIKIQSLLIIITLLICLAIWKYCS